MTVMPNSNRNQSVRRAGLAASVLTAIGASVCCIGPIAAAVLGIGSLGGLVRYEPLRPYFTVMTLALLAGAFFLLHPIRSDNRISLGGLPQLVGARVE